MSSAVSERTDSRPRADRGAARFEAAKDGRLVSRAIARAKLGDPEGLHFLYVRFAPDVQRYVTSIVRDHHEAEDITQNVFAKLVTAIKKYEQREVPFAAWIIRVAHNAAVDQMRARRPIPTEEIRLDDGGYSYAAYDQSRILRSAFSRLPKDQREVLVLRHVVGLTPTEIAGILDRSESSVHGLHHRGRRALQSSLTELEAAPMVRPGRA
jgi:RNA polymerase sigma-70 factor, ECF subfamily